MHQINPTTINLSEEGYLHNLEDWNEDVATYLASRHNISLTSDHWELIFLAQEFYRNYELSPSTRPLVNFIKKKLGKDKGNSIYLMQLFPGSSAKVLACIAGLPRPSQCF